MPHTNTHTSTLTAPAADTLLLTLDKAARQLCCARRSVERHVASHRLPVVHLGRSVRVERRELERFIALSRDPGGWPADDPRSESGNGSGDE